MLFYAYLYVGIHKVRTLVFDKLPKVCPVPLTARIKSSPISREEARRLKEGYVISLSGEIQLLAAEKPFGTVSLCRSGKQKAVLWKS